MEIVSQKNVKNYQIVVFVNYQKLETYSHVEPVMIIINNLRNNGLKISQVAVSVTCLNTCDSQPHVN